MFFIWEFKDIYFFTGVKPVFKTAYDLYGKQEKVIDPGNFHQIYTTFIQWVLIVLKLGMDNDLIIQWDPKGI